MLSHQIFILEGQSYEKKYTCIYSYYTKILKWNKLVRDFISDQKRKKNIIVVQSVFWRKRADYGIKYTAAIFVEDI